MTLEFIRSPDLLFWSLGIIIIIILFWLRSGLKDKNWYRVLTGLRTVVLLGLLLLLLQPVLTVKKIQTSDLPWIIYLDNSVSMRYHQTSSLSSINAGLERMFEILDKKNITYEVFTFADTLGEYDQILRLNAEGVTTDIGQVLVDLDKRRSKYAGALIISDGQPTQGADSYQILESISNRPIHTLGIGEETPMVDVAIQSIDVPTVAIKGEPVIVKVSIQTSGIIGKRLNASLYHGNKLLGSRYIQTGGGDSRTELQFQFNPDQIGKSEYRIHLSSLAEEINIQNNRQNFTVLVLKDRYKIALVTGSPNRNTSVLKRLLQQESRLQVDHYVQLDGRSMRPSLKQFWETPYDLIIFDQYPVRPLSRNFQRILGKKLLSNQTAFCLIVGPGQTIQETKGLFPFLGIKSIDSPSIKEAIPWTFTEQGITFGISQGIGIGQDFPPLVPGLAVIPASEKTQVLAVFMGDSTLPLIMSQEKGALRSLVWTSGDMASIHFRTTATNQSALLENFWSSAFAWLLRTGGKNELFFRLNKDIFQQGELIQVSGTRPYGKKGRTHPETVFIDVYRNTDKVLSKEFSYNLALERWETHLRASVPGNYNFKMRLGEGINSQILQSGFYTVMESQVELNKVFLNKSLLASLARKTGGEYRNWQDRKEILDFLHQKEDRELVADVFKFNEHPGLISAIFILLCIEWILRRRRGLP